MNGIQGRALRLVYTEYNSSYDELFPSTEIYKFKHNLGPEILNEIFEPALSSYNTRCDNIVHIRVCLYGTETVSSLMILKYVISLNEFKTTIKQWQPKNCTYRLCKTYVNGIGFLRW